jgi:hypothetical protein
MKAAALIMLALLIDGIQAGMSAAIFILSAFPGTFGGAAAGCAAGNAVAGQVGCSIGGFLLGLVGSIPLINGVLATVTMPVGVILGFAISVCLSLTLGAGLIMLLIIYGMFYPKYLMPGGISELIPGFDLIPGWTALTILCVLRKIRDEKTAQLKTAASVVLVEPASENLEQAARAVDGIRAPAAADDNNAQASQRYAA